MWRRLSRQYTLLPAALTVLVALVVLTLVSLVVLRDQRSAIWVSLIGSFWGFGLAQGGAIAYERARQRDELASMFVSARNELQMNKGIVIWIVHLLEQKLAEEDVHGLGFSGLDHFSVRAVETLVASPLTYRFTSDEFSSQQLLTILQTVLVYSREIPTDKVDGRDQQRYGRIRMDKVIVTFDLMSGWLDAEGKRVFGVAAWQSRVDRAAAMFERKHTIPVQNISSPDTAR
ncbi:hypothetical protein [Phytohabitans rumicis]|uniref:DUF4760 domain-containing protein n=1 Tax=Phytohabitans rumicis TaxID=1076125 RepID=A0A6V8L8R3_9ACTN|nr:hypothetical protein [Phytohabitans rumicis]GFJ93632.1 hypothetical protein Prum_072740 [Phytohabitans rumicis]